MPPEIAAYVEVGSKRTFAGAVEWPGWCRSGRDEDVAFTNLIGYGTRYAEALRGSRLGFEPPASVSGLRLSERLNGDATTDFGAPSIALEADARPVGDDELGRLRSILEGCWRTFDKVAQGARGRNLSKGPRGGGRDLAKIVDHVVDAEGAYLPMLGWKVDPGPRASAIDRTRSAILEALATTSVEGPPPPGPRGGKRWMPRYLVRRVAWHALDHAWEIEDRAEGRQGRVP